MNLEVRIIGSPCSEVCESERKLGEIQGRDYTILNAEQTFHTTCIRRFVLQ